MPLHAGVRPLYLSADAKASVCFVSIVSIVSFRSAEDTLPLLVAQQQPRNPSLSPLFCRPGLHSTLLDWTTHLDWTRIRMRRQLRLRVRGRAVALLQATVASALLGPTERSRPRASGSSCRLIHRRRRECEPQTEHRTQSLSRWPTSCRRRHGFFDGNRAPDMVSRRGNSAVGTSISILGFSLVVLSLLASNRDAPDPLGAADDTSRRGFDV